jgi:hypothetical protein
MPKIYYYILNTDLPKKKIYRDIVEKFSELLSKTNYLFMETAHSKILHYPKCNNKNQYRLLSVPWCNLLLCPKHTNLPPDMTTEKFTNGTMQNMSNTSIIHFEQKYF